MYQDFIQTIVKYLEILNQKLFLLYMIRFKKKSKDRISSNTIYVTMLSTL